MLGKKVKSTLALICTMVLLVSGSSYAQSIEGLKASTHRWKLPAGKTQPKSKSGTISPMMEVIKVTPQPGEPIDPWACASVYSDYCGWEGWYGVEYTGTDYPYTGDVGAASGGSNDGTKGRGSNFNREFPGCDRELQAQLDVAVYGNAGTPVGQDISMYVPNTDPAWPGYVKWQYSRTWVEWYKPTNTPTEWHIVIHYMYNPQTHDVGQVKMKTSFEFGCTGMKQQ